MTPIDAGIYGSIRPTAAADPMQTLAQVSVMRNQQLQRQEAQQRIAINQAAEERLAQSAQLADQKRQEELVAAEAKRQQDADLTAYLSSGQQIEPEKVYEITKTDPARGTSILNGLEALKQLHSKTVADVRQNALQLLGGVEALPEAGRAAVWPQIRQEAVDFGYPAERIPEQYSQAFVQMSLRSLQTPQQQVEEGKPKLQALPPGQPIYRSVGSEEPTLAFTTPEAQAKLGTAAHVIHGMYGDKPTPQQELMGLRMFEDATTKVPAQQRNYQPRQVKVDGTQVQANYDPDTGHYFHPDTGERLRNVQPADTADEKSKAAAKKTLMRSRAAMRTLGAQVITKVGPAQRTEAYKRGAAAVFGNDPEFQTYQDSRLAYAGNLAVSQQGTRPSDADIKAIWLPMVPDPYRDTKESFDMKNSMIDDFADLPPMVLPGAAGGPPSPGGLMDPNAAFEKMQNPKR